MSKTSDQVKIGTSGWSYGWKNFYPDGLSKDKHLSYFSSKFKTAEVNYSFYRLPKKKTYKKWAQETDKEFVFALKLSRYITHIKRLKGIKTELRSFIERSEPLEGRRGPVLVQLPPNFKIDLDKMEYFLKTAENLNKDIKAKGGEGVRYAFEFRHTEWFEESDKREKAINLLSCFNVCFVFGHSNKYPYPTDEPITTDFVYLRFHGPEEFAASEYGKEGLKPFSQKIDNWANDGYDVYAYFNNDGHGYAIKDARRLIEFLEID